jgi:glutamate dehydrogenase
MAATVEAMSAAPPAVAERLRALLTRRVSGPEAARLATFARLLLRRGAGYLEDLPDEEVAAMVASAFRFYAAPGPARRVRVLTPSYADEGWDAPLSIIETCMSDRPFVVDTLRTRLQARGVEVRTFLHPIFAARRDPTGRLDMLAPPEGTEPRESFTHIAVPRIDDPAELDRLATEVRTCLDDVHLVTDDFSPMVARAHAVAAELDARGRARDDAGAAEAAAVADFLRWLVDGAFVFLGYREYRFDTVRGERALGVRAGSGLGLLRREERSAFSEPQPAHELPDTVRTRLFGGRILTVTKTLAESPVHRRVRMDDVGVRELDAAGEVVGERRFVGLFTSKAYAEEAAEVPLLRRVLRQILTAEQVVPGSHDYREIVTIFNALPKFELFSSTPAEIRDEIRTIMAATRSDDVVVAVRPHATSPAAAVLIVMPSRRFSSEVRVRLEETVRTALGGTLLDDHLALGESDRTLLHFAYAVPARTDLDEITPRLRAAVVHIVRSWEERLAEALTARHGEGEGTRLAARFAPAFPDDYKAAVSAERAAEEVDALAAVERERAPHVTLRGGVEAQTTALRFTVAGAPLVLSECMPVLEHLGLRALAEDQVTVRPPDGAPLFMQTFFVQDRAGKALDVDGVGPRLTEALAALRAGRVESDVLNRLVLEAGLDWRAVDCLRTYCGYAAQAGLAARDVALGVLAEHPDPARLLFACFAERFRPGAPAQPEGEVRTRFLQSLEGVEILREDLLLRALLDVVEATVRTNFYRDSPARDFVAIKIRSADLAHLPAPRPLYEVYVHSATMEGIHLRSGRIARGGIRWSDRPEDFRTEVLGLMKTQTVKNAVIVPVGAKGGFVLKGRRDRDAVLGAYTTLIRGLLDLSDNLVGGRVVHPHGIVLRDEDDPYLVVAPDKGTASFSDAANAVAAEYGFWLGDAFASGGSHGYDHKALGITARGAWESVRTHFRDLGLDADTAPLTMAGIGDMGGDVFGNGALCSQHVRLRAAFNHLHVFLDPEPDPARSFAERTRLFRAAKGWDAYDQSLLSPGGAVLSRGAKRVTLSPEAQAMLGLAEATISGERLVQAVLKLDVDLLFNGGIGTYVGATGEPDAEIRDVANDPVRVRASDLRARVVGEGGNLGFTQRARIEFALAGGRINTDAVDNSGGVDMSDHEVNLKICLQAPLESGELTPQERNALLDAVTNDVAARVLAHNRAQSRLLGVDQIRSRSRAADFRELIAELERTAGLDRVLEALPDRDALRGRRATFLGLTRPELAVVMAYTKLHLRAEVLASALPDEPLAEPYLIAYFPPAVRERVPEAVRRHPLRREIVATELANALVDELGTTFVFRLTRDTGASVAEVVRAWTISRVVAGAGELLDAVARATPTAEVETTCHQVLEQTIERVTRWVLANADPTRPASEVAAEHAAAIGRVRARLPEWIGGAEAEAFAKLQSQLEIAGLPRPLARALATSDWLTGALDVVTVARDVGQDPEPVAARYYGLGQEIDFAWLWARLAEAGDDDRWQRRAVAGLSEDLLRARRRLAATVLRGGALPPRALTAIQALLRDLRAASRTSLAALQVVVREVGRLADAAAKEGRDRP